MKQNTFAKLRAEKNSYKNKYQASQEIITSQVDRIDTLDRAINIQDNQIKVLTNELKDYKAKRKRLIHKLKDSNLYKDYFYQEMIKENKNKLRITKKLAFSLVINVVLFVAVITMSIK